MNVSSSSVYGQVDAAMSEDMPLRPASPYGITKAAGEMLCRAYASRGGIANLVQMRLFSVYGPQQRSDMVFARWINALESGTELVITGDGRQCRDFTFVLDVVEALLEAASFDGPVGTFNVALGEPRSLVEALKILTLMLREGAYSRLVRTQVPQGDVLRTAADIAKYRANFRNWPSTSLEDGLAQQVAAHFGFDDTYRGPYATAVSELLE